MRTALLILIGTMLVFAAQAQTHTQSQAQSQAQTQPGKVGLKEKEAVVGYYRFKSGVDMKVYLDDGLLMVKSTGQPPQFLNGTADGRFNYPSIPGYLTFDLGADGKAKTLHFHYDDKSLAAQKIGEALAQKASDALALKIKNQTHDEKCTATLKRFVEEQRAGKPDYSKMTLTLGQAVRTQLPALQPRLQQWGALKEATFKGVNPAGAEAFDVAFENGTAQFLIFCIGDGYISGAGMR